jgi:hypothetical protein
MTGTDLCVNKSQFVPVISEPPCTWTVLLVIKEFVIKFLNRYHNFSLNHIKADATTQKPWTAVLHSNHVQSTYSNTKKIFTVVMHLITFIIRTFQILLEVLITVTDFFRTRSV